MGFRVVVGGTRSLWVVILFFSFQHALVINNGGERFCSARISTKRGYWQGADDGGSFTGPASEPVDPERITPEYRIPLGSPHEDRAISSYFSSRASKVFASKETGELPLERDKVTAEKQHLPSSAAFVAHPEPVASIPVCVKPHVTILLQHAFDMLVYNQRRYLVARRRQQAKKAVSTQGGDQEEEKKRGSRALKQDDASVDLIDRHTGEAKAPIAKKAKNIEREGLAEFIRAGILCALIGKPYESVLSNEAPPWAREVFNAGDDDSAEDHSDHVDGDGNLDLPTFFSASSSYFPLPLLSKREAWERAYERLFPRSKESHEEHAPAATAENVAPSSRYPHINSIVRKLQRSSQLEDLAALLHNIGRTTLPNEPEKAVIYLPLLLEDTDAMDLWRSHIVRHVLDRFRFDSCADTEKQAALMATVLLKDQRAMQEVAAKGDIERVHAPETPEAQRRNIMPESEANNEKENGFFPRFIRWWRPVQMHIRLVPPFLREGIVGAYKEIAERKEERRKGGHNDASRASLQDERDKESSERVRSITRQEARKSATNFIKHLLEQDWKGLHVLLLSVMQREFWMSRPAASSAAVQMVQMALRDLNEREHWKAGGNEQDTVESEGALQNQQQQKHWSKKGDEGDDQTVEKEDEEGRRSTAAPEKALWEPEVSLRFRYLSMKDAKRMMGAFLTSNLHPEMGFPTGTKLPPKTTCTRSKRRLEAMNDKGAALQESGSAGIKKTDGDTEDGNNAEDCGDFEEDEEDDKEPIPRNFDAREAFPLCSVVIGHVRDQGSCGSCWAFSSTTSFNDRLCISSGGEMNQLLSPQHTTSCCSSILCNSFGCDGGEPSLAWRWFTRQGIVSGGDQDTLNKGETCWPYEIPFCNHHADSPFPDCNDAFPIIDTPACRRECEEVLYTENVHPFEEDLHRATRAYSFASRKRAKKGIMRAGSISASFMVYEDFLVYKSGVYKHVYGGPLGGHAAKVIGWGVEDGVDYWQLVNSWNSYWGEKGLVKIEMGEAGIDDDLVAGDVLWHPRTGKPARVEESTVAPPSPAEQTDLHYREM